MLLRLAKRTQSHACRLSARSVQCTSAVTVKSWVPETRAPVLTPPFPEPASFFAWQHRTNNASMVQKRGYAASQPTGSEEDKAQSSDEVTKEEKSVLRKFYGVGTVVTGGAIAYGAWWSINSAMKMVGAVYASPHIVAYAGFWFGFGTATACAALGIGLYRLTFIRPEYAFKDTFAVVKNNDAVKAALGSTIRDGKLKTYEINDGRFSVSGGMPTWLPHKLQMMYIVYGEKGMGLVTTVCEKKPSLIPRALDPNLLAVDFLDKDKINKDQETLVIVGQESQLEVRDNIHRLLDLKLDFAMGNQTHKS